MACSVVVMLLDKRVTRSILIHCFAWYSRKQAAHARLSVSSSII